MGKRSGATAMTESRSDTARSDADERARAAFEALVASFHSLTLECCDAETDAEVIALCGPWKQARKALIDAFDSALAQRDEDAARYRWLREQAWPWGSRWLSLKPLDDAVDVALDAARAQTGEARRDGDG